MMNKRYFFAAALVLVSAIYFQPALQQMDDDDDWNNSPQPSEEEPEEPTSYDWGESSTGPDPSWFKENPEHKLTGALWAGGGMSGQSSDCPDNYELIDKYDDEPSEWKNALF